MCNLAPLRLPPPYPQHLVSGFIFIVFFNFILQWPLGIYFFLHYSKTFAEASFCCFSVEGLKTKRTLDMGVMTLYLTNFESRCYTVNDAFFPFTSRSAHYRRV